MENGEKMFSFTASATNSSLKMPLTEFTKALTAPTAITLNQSNFYEFHTQHQQPPPHFSFTDAGNDPYAAYTNNFDLSLLPQESATATANKTTVPVTPASAADIPTNLLEQNIPTTVFSFDQSSQQEDQKPQLLAVPEIKIEQTWSSCPSLNTIKQEQSYRSYFPLNAQHSKLTPPPAYPSSIFHSPQSSPAQSEYGYPQTQPSGCYESLSSSRNSLYATELIDSHSIKQEQLHILPPSPPESSCDTPTPHSSCSSATGFDFKSEPFDSDVETFSDLKLNPQAPRETLTSSTLAGDQHQVLREYLQDTTFQKQHNLKPLALDSFIGGLDEVRDNFEPVISLALEHAKREADATCAKLQISQDPSKWSANQVHAWLRSTIQQFELPWINDLENKFTENGLGLLQLTEEEFARRAPGAGSILHAQLEIWKLTYTEDHHKINANTNNNNINSICMQQGNWPSTIMPGQLKNEMEEDTEDEDDFLSNINNAPGILPMANANDSNNSNCHYTGNEQGQSNPLAEGQQVTAVKRPGGRNGGSHIHLWQFLKELLAAPQVNGTAIRWIDRTKGIFKIEDSVRVAKLWGKRKNRPAMNYDKLSRSIRQYYKKGIMKKTERSQRLVYQFCQPYNM